jgi:cell division transport system permease protein
VSAFLINTTVTTGINVRREEIGIMKLIGATNAFVRLPFVLEGILIGLIGAAIPLIIIYFVYNSAVNYILQRFEVLTNFMNGLLPVNSVYGLLLPVGLLLGVGIALIGSMVAIHKHLNV